MTQGPLAAGAGGAGLAPVGQDGDEERGASSQRCPPRTPAPHRDGALKGCLPLGSATSTPCCSLLVALR